MVLDDDDGLVDILRNALDTHPNANFDGISKNDTMICKSSDGRYENAFMDHRCYEILDSGLNIVFQIQHF